jgi:hypothetical protein
VNTETILMISFFQAVEPVGSMILTADQYLEDVGLELDRTVRVLKFLGLAKDAAESDLGWVPTPRLLQIIAERAARPLSKSNVAESYVDQSFVHSLMMRATDEVPDEESMDTFEFCWSILAALGLLQEVEAGGYKPTRRMREVMLAACLEQPVQAA